MLKIVVNGINGKIGQMIVNCLAKSEDMVIVAGVDKMPDAIKNPFPVYDAMHKVVESVDVVIDFSRPDALHEVLEFAQSKNVGAVLCTTGYTANDKMMIVKYSGHIPVFYSANMSLGVNLQMELAKKAAEFFGDAFDVEIVEKHHNQKVDAPSGTALAIAEYMNTAYTPAKEFVYGRTPGSGKREPNEMGIHALRGGTVVGEHEVFFFGEDEVIEITHKALSRRVFVEGALRAAQFLQEMNPGLYSMFDIISQAQHTTHISTTEECARVQLQGSSETIQTIMQTFAKSDVHVDMVCFCSDGGYNFLVESKDLAAAKGILKQCGALSVNIMEGLSSVCAEGADIQSQPGRIADLFASFMQQSIPIVLSQTTPTTVSLCVQQEHVPKSIRILTNSFNL